jgi:hypothetical protein
LTFKTSQRNVIIVYKVRRYRSEGPHSANIDEGLQGLGEEGPGGHLVQTASLRGLFMLAAIKWRFHLWKQGLSLFLKPASTQNYSSIFLRKPHYCHFRNCDGHLELYSKLQRDGKPNRVAR